MIKISKKEEPKEWTAYKNIPGVEFSGIKELQKSLLEEQGYICAYCERRIPVKDKVSTESHRIEHWHCRDQFKDEIFNYGNLLMCCPGQIGGGESHCDVKKDKEIIEWTPLREECTDSIYYQNNGNAFSTNNVWNKEINVNLNLNHPLLKLNRKETLQGVIDTINRKKKKGESWNLKDVRNLLRKWNSKYIDKSGNSVLHPYCGIVVYYLKRKENSLLKQL